MTDEQFWERVRQIAAAEAPPPIPKGPHPSVQRPEAVAEHYDRNLLRAILERSARDGDKTLAYSALRTYSGMTERGAVWPDDWISMVWDAIHHAAPAGETDRAEFLGFAMAVQRNDWWSLVSPGKLPAILFESPDQPKPEDAARLRKLVEWAAGKIADSGKELEVFVRNGGTIETAASHGYGFEMGARRVRSHYSDVLHAVARRYLPPEWQWKAIELVGGEAQIMMGEYRPPRIERVHSDWRGALVVEITGEWKSAPLWGAAATAAIDAFRTGRPITKAEMAAWGVR